ncbi:MAG: hypothetical protein AB1689_10380 [Thermodesulfobacteriota bacterium]
MIPGYDRVPVQRVRAHTAAALAALSLLLAPAMAHAIKWRECPQAPTAVYPSAIGATTSPFAHPGHALRIVLNASEAAASGGFSPEPEGNEVEIAFVPSFGAPVALAPRRASAVSSTVLELAFPDTQAELGRSLAGPVEIRVRVGDRLIAWIAAKSFVALPPATDVTGLLLGGEQHAVVQAALDARGDLWIPVNFRGDPMAMPGCPGNYIQPAKVAVGGASLNPSLGRRDPLKNVRGASLFLGDVIINDTSLYGMLFMDRLPLVHVAGTRGISLCKLNDAMDLVVRVRGRRAWARNARTAIAPRIADARPLEVVLRGAAPAPGKIAWLTRATDSFGNACPTTPFHAADGAAPASAGR